MATLSGGVGKTLAALFIISIRLVCVDPEELDTVELLFALNTESGLGNRADRLLDAIVEGVLGMRLIVGIPGANLGWTLVTMP